MNNPLAPLALEEFTARNANYRAGIAAGQITQGQADQAFAHWCAIAAYFGAPLPERLNGSDNSPPYWIDFYPAQQRVDISMTAMAGELRRATLVAITHYQQAPQDAKVRARVRRLIKLDSHLHYRAGLPMLAIEGTLTPELDAPEREAA